MNTHKAKIILISAMALFGTIGYFLKQIPLRAAEIALYRSILATIALGIYLWLTKKPLAFGKVKKELALLFVSGVCLGFGWILFINALNSTTVSLATLSYYIAPLLITIACAILFQEKINKNTWMCFGVASLGIVLITSIDTGNAAQNHILGIGFALLAALCYAAVVILNKYIKNINGIERTFLQFASSSIVLLPYVLLTGGMHIATLQTNAWFFLLFIGLVHTGICYCMYFSALKWIPGNQVALLSYIDPLVAVMVSVLLLHEAMAPLQMLGGMLVLGATLWNQCAETKTK
ncbi:MAG: EamA family transporter [Eubacteriales bacterium]|nr:EamA family transporter [Eubacteriales bacterium]